MGGCGLLPQPRPPYCLGVPHPRSSWRHHWPSRSSRCPSSGALRIAATRRCSPTEEITPDVEPLIDVAAAGQRPWWAEHHLYGTQWGHFGAFGKKEWREHDWLWGRLDGARRLAEILLADASETTRHELLDRLGKAILADEGRQIDDVQAASKAVVSADGATLWEAVRHRDAAQHPAGDRGQAGVTAPPQPTPERRRAGPGRRWHLAPDWPARRVVVDADPAAGDPGRRSRSLLVATSLPALKDRKAIVRWRLTSPATDASSQRAPAR